MPVITEQELEDAAVDAQVLEDVVNGAADRPNPGHPDGTVQTRLGGTVKTLARIIEDQELQEQTATEQAEIATDAAADAVAAAAALEGKMDSLPGPDDLVFVNGDTQASFAEGTQFIVTPTDITHPLLDSLKRESGRNLPGPEGVFFFDLDGKLIDTGSTVAAAIGSGELISKPDFVIFGDSLATSALGFANELAALYPSRSVIAQGIGGQQAADIAIRMGADEGLITVTANTIPASGGGVVCTAPVPDPFHASIGDPASFLASLFDVPGVLKKVGSVYTFTRSDVGGPIAVPGPCPFRLLSGFASNATADGVSLLADALKRTLVMRYAHNDVFNDVIRDLATYDRETVKDFIRAAVQGMRSAAPHIVCCSITRGFVWLTDARAQGLGAAPGMGQAANDAETIEAVIEAQALNTWMADTFEGYVDLMAAYKAAEPSAGDYITTINFGAGHVYDFGNLTILGDGAHGTDGGIAQTIDAAAIAATLLEKGW